MVHMFVNNELMCIPIPVQVFGVNHNVIRFTEDPSNLFKRNAFRFWQNKDTYDAADKCNTSRFGAISACLGWYHV